jgi:pyruvate/2-oxoglutarate/acetoin dehydrogenase E1 component
MGRLVVVHEAPMAGGFGGEIAAPIQDTHFGFLKAPIKRICGHDAPFPYVDERIYLPSLNPVAESIKMLIDR